MKTYQQRIENAEIAIESAKKVLGAGGYRKGVIS